MSWVLIVVGGLAALILFGIGIPFIKKSNYAKAVYRELESMRDAGFVLDVRDSPDEELRMQVSLLQMEELKNCYVGGVTPANAAKAMAAAVNQMFADEPRPP